MLKANFCPGCYIGFTANKFVTEAFLDEVALSSRRGPPSLFLTSRK
jgi:hypothetical protein